MKFRVMLVVAAALAGSLLIAEWGAGQDFQRRQSAPPAAPEPNQQSGPEVLARGPVHEAFAEPTETRPTPSPLVNKQPPAPIEEMPPDQRPAGENVQWIAG